ncbi:MAG TPA: proton-conducting transporter membrane subunit, partial [bacterium]|nr:proton-conducting transporter membrane subunit [bacterium]
GGVLVLCMLSLAGLPPTGGFLGKLYLFRAALAGGQTALAIVAVLTSVVSVYYYFRVAYVVLSPGAPEGVTVRPNFPVGVALALAAVGVLWLGILPGGFWDFVQQAVLALK